MTRPWSSPEAKTHPTRAEAVMTIERDLLELYRDPTLDTKPELLEHRGGAFYSEEAVLAANRRWLPRFFRDG
jgi:alpha-galactosidase/6-phospho-beta-glucosidase family protein